MPYDAARVERQVLGIGETLYWTDIHVHTAGLGAASAAADRQIDYICEA